MTKASSIKTTCAYCGVGCGVIATPQVDGSVAIEGDQEHPANFGRLCSKGTALGETIGLEDRLLHPEVHGKRTGWDEALSLVANKFKSTIEEHGPDSVAFYVSGQILTEDYYVANKLMKGYIGSANIDTNSRLCMASSVAGHRRAFGADTVPGTYEDMEQADLVVLVGSNLAWCHPVLFQRLDAAKQANPNMKVVVVDPRETMTCSLADLHLPLAADGDEALFAGLLNHLEATGCVDQNYVTKHTHGFDDALQAVSSLTVSEVAASSGLAENDINTFYQWFATTEKVVTVYSQGVNQSAGGTNKVNAILNCHLATGRIGKAGMGPFSVTGQPNAMGGREVGGLANMLAAHMAIENEDHRTLVQEFWKSPAIADKPGFKAVDLFQAVEEGKVKAIWIMATNPVVSMPEADRVRAALAQCDFVVVSDVLDQTDTITSAHVRLPAAAWGEKSGTVTNSERRISRQRSFLSLPGEAQPDWWHICEVAKRMGFGSAFSYEDEAAIFREHAALSAYDNNGLRDFDIGAYKSVTRQDYYDLSPFQWPQRSGETPSTSRFFANGGFYTENGRANLIAYSGTTAKTEPSILTLNTGRVRDHWHTMTRTGKSARLSSHMAEPYCEIHPSDATGLGISDADLVRVYNGYGEVLVRALITERQKAGNVFVPMHWTDQFSSAGRVDTIVPMVTDPFSGQPASKNAPVSMEKFEASYYGFWVGMQKPKALDADYWALAQSQTGWRLEFASKDALNFEAYLEHFQPTEDALALSYIDNKSGQYRYAWFEGDTLVGLLYVCRTPVSVDRTWAVDQIGKAFDRADRPKVMSGRPGKDQGNRGRIVCACNNVGINQIYEAMSQGATTVDAVGQSCTAGTNCGSCRSEIQEIINVTRREAAE